jgi:hypothetical protein
MVNPFYQTPAEKEEYVLDMLERGYGWNQIMKECHVSPTTISKVKKKFFGPSDDGTSKNAGQITKETQCFTCFQQGKSLLATKMETDIQSSEVVEYYKKYQELLNHDHFNIAYNSVSGNIVPFLNLFNLMNSLGLTPEQIQEQVQYGYRLPQLQNIHKMLGNQVRLLESYRHNLHSQLNAMTIQIEDYKYSLDYCINEFEQKRYGLLALDYQTKNMQNFIQEFDNQEGYQRIKKESTEQTKSIIKNNHLLVAVTVSSTLEAIRRYPYNQQLFYDLSVPGSYSTSSSHQQTWMQSHTTQLLQLSEQVQTEIAEQITKMVISKIQDKNCLSEV